MAVLERARAVGEGLENPLRQHDRADRLVAAAQSLGDRHQIGRNALLLAGVERSRASHAAHDFVENEQNPVTVADRSDAPEVVGCRRNRAQGRPNHGLGHEGDHALRADLEQLVLEGLSGARCVVGVAFALALQTVGVAEVDVMRLDQERLELGAPLRVSACLQRSQGVPVVALASRDEHAALGFARLDKILARHFERRLDRLGPAADEHDVIDAGGRVLDQPVSETLGDIGSEERRMRIGEGVELLVQGGEHRRMAMPEAGHRCAA
jgi:hypothetical protein